jgi:hypothetical protein
LLLTPSWNLTRQTKGENMDGYFKPKLKGPIKGLRSLKLEEIEHVSEEGEIDFSEDDCKSGRLHKCPRCKAVTRLETYDPHCPECNWDSLTDPSMETNKCAA